MIILIPLIASITAFCMHFLYKKYNMNYWFFILINPALIFIAAYFSIIYLLNPDIISQSLYEWLELGEVIIGIDVYLDDISKPMLAVVLCISALVHLYAVGYLSSYKTIFLFLSYISLFTFFMVLLVVSKNLIQLFIGWEGVGVVSFMLIGFYHKKELAGHCAVKAFMTNRVADTFFIIGICLAFLTFGTLDLTVIENIFKSNSFNQISYLGEYTIFFMCFCLFIGAIGKSAQFGFHVWLPDAMIAPTPTSILIHAATMVAAGVFFMCKIGYILHTLPGMSSFIAFLGCMTAVFAGTVALVQNDIKKIVAYSTVSQLGYMFIAIGTFQYEAAMFHLTTHAFFKALLFAGSGLIICYANGEQDIRKIGGIFLLNPILGICMWLGTLALCGIPPLSGAISKDLILVGIMHSHVYGYQLIFTMAVIGAVLTSIYSTRSMYKVFHSAQKNPFKALSSWDLNTMNIPILITTIFAVISGFIFKNYFMGHHLHHGNMDHIYENIILTAIGLGLIISFISFYVLKVNWASYKMLSGAINFFENRWYIDTIYHKIFVNPSFYVGNKLWRIADKLIIDSYMILVWKYIIRDIYIDINKSYNGYIRFYLFITIFSLFSLVLINYLICVFQ